MTPENQVSDLLIRLAGRNHQSAWSEFLETHASTIQTVVARFDRDPDHQGDCFVFVCERLARNRYKRLRSFEPEGPAAFRTWLMAVILNLAIDWRRSVWGRVRPFQRIAEMEPLEIEVYRAIFEQGMSLDQTRASLVHSHLHLTLNDISNIVGKLHQALSSRQHWLLSVRRPFLHSIESLAGESGDSEGLSVLASTDDDPEAMAGQSELRRRLIAAMAVLEADERLAVRLRFQEGQTLREISRQMKIGDPFRVRRLLDRALNKLRENWATTKESSIQSKMKGAVRVMRVKRARTERDV